MSANASMVSVGQMTVDHPVLLSAAQWCREDQKVCLVTLVNVDGTGPRTVGAQMAVSASGKAVGYLTGGCLEQDFALMAVEAIKTGKPQIERYGKGSRFIDLRLPCGSGIDVLFDPLLSPELLDEARTMLEERIPFSLVTDTETGKSHLCRFRDEILERRQSPIKDGIFERLYPPALRAVIFGDGYAPLQLALVLNAIGMNVRLFSDDPFTRERASGLGLAIQPTSAFLESDEDEWTAAAVLFHAHEQDLPVLERLLVGRCFYLGAIGGRVATAARAQALQARGISQTKLRQLKAPAGLVRGARSATELAVGIAAEILDTARHQRRVI